MKRIAQLVAIPVLALLTMGHHHKSALTIIRFDTLPSGEIAETGTSNTVHVTVTFTDWTAKTYSGVSFSAVSEAIDLRLTDVHYTEVVAVRLTTTGGNWLWIDQVELFGNGPAGIEEKWQRGTDNANGWCISQEPGDGNNTVCDPDGSTPSVIWYPP